MSPTPVIRVTNPTQLVIAGREILPGYAAVGNEDGSIQVLHRACDTLLAVEWHGFPPLGEVLAVAAGHADTCPGHAPDLEPANCNGLCEYHCGEGR